MAFKRVPLWWYHWVNSIISGRSPPLYCTLTLITMQGHQKNSKDKTVVVCDIIKHSYIVYFVCVPASEFGAMGSTSFLGFSYPSLLLVFLNRLFFRNLYHIFLAASVGTLSGSFFILSLFFCTIFWVSLKGQVYKSSTSTF